MLDALFVSTVSVAIAEIGDRTQLLSLILIQRYRKPWPILGGVLVATVLNHFLAAWAGHWVASHVPVHSLKYGLAACFIATALWLLIPDKEDEGTQLWAGAGAFLATVVAFFIAEIGDKTQIATSLLGARYPQTGLVVAGSTIGMMLANAPVIWLGHLFGQNIPMKWVRYTASLIFGALALAALIG